MAGDIESEIVYCKDGSRKSMVRLRGPRTFVRQVTEHLSIDLLADR
jgi:hypothetical protein